MIERIRNNKNIWYFVAYSASYIGYGTLLTGLGPIIPFLSDITHKLQTEYSFLMSCRALGILCGSIVIKIIQKYQIRISFHQMLLYSSLFILLCSVFFSLAVDWPFAQGIAIFLSGFFYSSMEIIINVCLIMITPSKQIQFWFFLTHGFFGIGGLIGPIIIQVFKQNSFIILGVIVFIVSPAYYKLESPELKMSKQIDHKTQLNILDIRLPLRKSGIVHETKYQEPTQFISDQTEKLLCLMLFVYIGLQFGYGGWISSYTVMAGIQDKQSATKYVTIFWIFITAFRFILACVNLKSSTKMIRLMLIIIVWSILCLVLIKSFGFVKLGCILSSCIYGLAFSSLYPLVFSLPMQFGLTLSPSQTSTISLVAIIAEGVLSMFVGLLMKWFFIDMLFYSMLVMGIIIILLHIMIISFMKRDHQEKGKQTELTTRFNP